jgi:hypothetical protein
VALVEAWEIEFFGFGIFYCGLNQLKMMGERRMLPFESHFLVNSQLFLLLA